MTNSEYKQSRGFLLKARAVSLMAFICLLCCGADKSAGRDLYLSMGYTGSGYPYISNNDMNASVSMLAQRIARQKMGKGDAWYYDYMREGGLSIDTSFSSVNETSVAKGSRK